MAYLYKHVRQDTGETFYIGISNNDDLSFKRAFDTRSRNNFWKSVVNKTDYDVIIVEKNTSWEEACLEEKELIKSIGRRDLDQGSLVNLTDGGEGHINMSEITKRKIGEKNKGSFEEKFGSEKAKQIKDKMSKSKIGNQSRLGIPHSEETLEQLKKISSQRDKEFWTNKERCEKISKSKKGSHHTEDTKKRISQSNRGTYIERYGEERAKEIGDKISKANKGKSRPAQSLAMKRNIDNGTHPFLVNPTPMSEEAKEKARIRCINNNPNKSHLEEVRNKISESKKGLTSPFKGVKRKTVACPHCQKEGGEGVMQRWHFNNCKFLKDGPESNSS